MGTKQVGLLPPLISMLAAECCYWYLNLLTAVWRLPVLDVGPVAVKTAPAVDLHRPTVIIQASF